MRAPESGGDEIGMLAQTFNRMTDALEKNILDLKRTQILTMTKLAELAEKRDPDTGSHLQRIPLYCRALAEELRRDSPYAEMLTDDYMDALAEASSLHDIGKVGVPDAILQKPGPLTPDEFEIIRRHPLIGADVLSGAEFLAMARDIALCHHERYDGKGYPHGLAGEEIPLSARIVAVADMYDALTSRRAYKEALSHAQAFEMLKEPVSHERAATILAKQSGRHFDPEVMRALLRSEAAFREIRDRFSD
jgi:putative two-component system response regulator